MSVLAWLDDAIDRGARWALRNLYESNPVGRLVIRVWVDIRSTGGISYEGAAGAGKDEL